MQFLNRRRCGGKSRDAKRAEIAPRSALSQRARDPGVARSHRRRSFPTQRSYSRRAPAHSLTTPDGSHYENESPRRLRERHHSAQARAVSPSQCLPAVPTARIPRSIGQSTVLGSAPFSNLAKVLRAFRTALKCKPLKCVDFNIFYEFYCRRRGA